MRFQEWGIDGSVFENAVKAYSISEPDAIPYIDAIVRNLNFS